jgi:hypothetical protein
MKGSEGAVAHLRVLVGKLAKKRGAEGLGALGANVEREHAAALRAPRESGLYRSRGEVGRLRTGAILAAERRHAALRDAVDKYAFDRLAALDESLLDGIDGDVAGSVDNATWRLLARIDALERAEIRRINGEYEAMADRMEKCSGDTRACAAIRTSPGRLWKMSTAARWRISPPRSDY